MTTVHSFDVFDTCLVRTFARPEDLFTELARQLLPASATAEQVTDLARQRRQAETAARRAARHEDITLNDIYRHFEPTLAAWNLSQNSAMTTEINLEIASVRPVRAIAQRIAQLRRHDFRVVFISDMYLPTSVIRLMLVNRGLALPTDPVYVSGDIGVTKASGRLFDYVLAQECLTPAQLHHHGDNPLADVISARRRKIRAVYFHRSRLNHYERLLLHTGLSEHAQSRMAAVARAARLQYKGDALSPATVNLVAGVVAPLLTAYVAWVLQQAHMEGVERLYFVARDGQVLHAIARIFSRYFPTPQLEYLYGSRQAWFLPAVFKSHPSEMDWLALHYPTLRHMLKKLNLQPEEIGTILKSQELNSWDAVLTSAQMLKFWQVISHPVVKQLINERATSARQLTISYFEQAGLFDPGKWALVDVGWTLKSQRAVRRLIQSVKPSVEVHGYYLGVTNERIPLSQSGPYRAFVTETSYGSALNLPGQQLFRNINMVEQLFTMAQHGSTTGYRQSRTTVKPVLNNNLSFQQRNFAADIHRLVCSYADDFAQADLIGEIPAVRHAALVGVDKFMENPTRVAAQAIAWVPIGEDQNETRRQPLARPITLGDIIYYAARFTKIIAPRNFSAGHSWWAGSVTLSNWWVRRLFNKFEWVIKFRASGGLLKLRRFWWKLTGTKTI